MVVVQRVVDVAAVAARAHEPQRAQEPQVVRGRARAQPGGAGELLDRALTVDAARSAAAAGSGDASALSVSASSSASSRASELGGCAAYSRAYTYEHVFKRWDGVMAKRSVRKQRREGPAPAGAQPQPAPASSPAWRSPTFWLGGLVVGLAVAAVAVAAFVLSGSEDDETPAAASATATPGSEIESAEELQAGFDQRDREQIEALTKQADDVAATLQPVMGGLEKALPYDGAPGGQASDDQVREAADTARNARLQGLQG